MFFLQRLAVWECHILCGKETEYAILDQVVLFTDKFIFVFKDILQLYSKLDEEFELVILVPYGLIQ